MNSENIFKNLLGLFGKKELKIPLENFVTEIFAGILSKDSELTKKFIKQLLSENNFYSENIDLENLTVTTQYPIEGKNIDICIENNSFICFIENKINSPEGDQQLENYSKILAKKKQEDPDIFTLLAYCTRYNDEKNGDYGNFLQFRWGDVAKFLKREFNLENIKSPKEKSEKNQIVVEFLNFLEEERIVFMNDFNYVDLVVLDNLKETISKMDDIFKEIKPVMKKKFGNIDGDITLTKWRDFEAYLIYSKNVLGNGEVHVSFEKGTSEILTSVGIYLPPNNKFINDIASYENEEKQIEIYDSEGIKILHFYNSLSDFFGEHDALLSWFKEKLDEIEKIIDELKSSKI